MAMALMSSVIHILQAVKLCQFHKVCLKTVCVLVLATNAKTKKGVGRGQ